MKSLSLSDLQMDVMRVLWDRGEATVSDVHESLRSERSLAPTTIATILTRLEKRDLVVHRVHGRQFIYRSLVSEQDVRSSMVDDLTGRLFQGDLASLVSHLLTEREMSPGDLARVRALIEDAEAREESSDDS